MNDEVQDRLDRLARATAEIRARPGAADRVLAAIDADAPFGRQVWRAGRVALAGLVAATIACAVWSAHVETSFDEGVLASFDGIELEP
jgi:ferric-dicitrate binding protein FerR (iron transport regulator)